MVQYNDILQQKIAALKQNGQYRYFLDVNKSAQHFPNFYFENENGEKRKAVNWCSNDYMCMSIHEEIISKLCFVTHKSGAGSGGTRNISGTTTYHKVLENTLATLHKKEAALLFNGAYLANVTALSALGKLFDDLIFISDEENHASIIEGIKASGCKKIIFQHNNVQHLQTILQQLPIHQPKVIVFESVYSISGTIAPINEIVLLAKQYNALTYVDEVHAVGLYGNTGGGLTEHVQVQNGIDIINGTLAKGFGIIGGYIAANKNMIDAIRSIGSGFIFTTSLPPAICAAATKSIKILKDNTYRITFHNNVQLLREWLVKYSIPFSNNDAHITPIKIGNAIICKKIADELLFNYGLYVQPVNFPTVKVGHECLRITITPKHTLADIEYLAKCLYNVLVKKEQHYNGAIKMEHNFD